MIENDDNSTCHAVAEIVRVRSRFSSVQGSDLQGLVKRFPELAPVQAYIQTDSRFDLEAAKVIVVEDHISTGFMTGRRGALHGALVVIDFELVKRFERADLGLSEQPESTAALDRHLPYHARPT